MSLTQAAQTMLTELDGLAKWEHELRQDLKETRGRFEKLTQSLDVLLSMLDRPDRMRLQAQITAIRLPMNRRRAPSNTSAKVDAVHAWLAERETPFTAAEVQAMLTAQGLTNGQHNASIILSRKVGQGMVRRLGRGRYEVCAQSPDIIARRASAE